MEKSGFIARFYDKPYEKKEIDELCEAPISAISGISESDALVLKVAFGVKTVRDLAMNKYVKLAQGVRCFSEPECSEQILDRRFDSRVCEVLAKKPISTIKGITEGNAALLKRTFGIDTVKELAENKYVLIAQTTVAMASMLNILKTARVL